MWGRAAARPDLITLRGHRLLSEADVVIYAGSLVNPALLEAVKPGCEIHDSAGMTLEEVFAVMRAAEAGGKTTVRLHTGDPALYGAIREQIDLLKEAGIPYDVTPGSAPSAARRPRSAWNIRCPASPSRSSSPGWRAARRCPNGRRSPPSPPTARRWWSS